MRRRSPRRVETDVPLEAKSQDLERFLDVYGHRRVSDRTAGLFHFSRHATFIAASFLSRLGDHATATTNFALRLFFLLPITQKCYLTVQVVNGFAPTLGG
jgi:hypothetical protein